MRGPDEAVAGGPLRGHVRTEGAGAWLFSWPLLMGIAAYVAFLGLGQRVLLDGDTYTHIAAGEWILQHGTVPSYDPFSHSKPGAAWTAHEWLSEVVLALAQRVGGWTAVVAVSALAFATAMALLTRTLLKSLEPIYALLFAGMAVAMTAGHLFARPHILAMPLLIAWSVELVRAVESKRAPSPWMFPMMAIWANLHGGFTLGLALAFPFALEALLEARREQRVAQTARSWGLFIVLAVLSSMVTPHGLQGILFTWQLHFDNSYALERIGEWRSPEFQTLQPFELWLLGGLAAVMYQGLKLPPIRLVLLLGLLHLALKHYRHVELLGLLAPLFIAAPLAAQWRDRQNAKQQLEGADRFFKALARPAGRGAMALGLALVIGIPLAIDRLNPLEPPAIVAPVDAINAVRKAGIKGPVLNSYGWGGYLTYAGIAPFIDGRADMYGDAFLRQYVEAMELKTPESLTRVLDQYKITWTLLMPDSSSVALLDRLPEWRRLYADARTVVHVRANPERRPDAGEAR
jgi:hypothetical protein